MAHLFLPYTDYILRPKFGITLERITTEVLNLIDIIQISSKIRQQNSRNPNILSASPDVLNLKISFLSVDFIPFWSICDCTYFS